MAAGQSQVAGIQAGSPPHSFMSPSHMSPSELGWSASTAGVTIPATAAGDVNSSATDNT